MIRSKAADLLSRTYYVTFETNIYFFKFSFISNYIFICLIVMS